MLQHLEKPIAKEKIVKSPSSTILVAHGKMISACTFLLYISLQFLLHGHIFLAPNTVCDHHVELSPLTKSVVLLSAVSFSISCVLQLKPYFLWGLVWIRHRQGAMKQKNDSVSVIDDQYLILNLVTFVVNFIAGSSCVITYLKTDRMCMDGFG